MELLWEIAGWVGAVAILSAYLAVSMGWLKAGKGFQTANLFGAVAFIVNGIVHGAWPSVVTNVAWFLISAMALFRMRSAGEQLVVSAEDREVQFPGVPDTTGQIAVVEVLSGGVHDEANGHRLPNDCSTTVRPALRRPADLGPHKT